MKIIVLNCGSSSIKYQLFDMTTHEIMAKGKSGGKGKAGWPSKNPGKPSGGGRDKNPPKGKGK